MTWATVAVVGGSLIGGMLGSSASKKAAGQQAAAARDATAEERRQFDLSRSDLAGYRNRGESAGSRLADLLGISTQSSRVGLSAPTREQFTTTTQGQAAVPVALDPRSAGWGQQPRAAIPGTTSFDQTGYNAALSQYQAQLAQSGVKPEGFGSLLDPFTGEDLASEPGYAFGLAEGEKAVQRGAARNGMRLSPATMKALIRFNGDFAGTKFNDAFTRDLQGKQNTFNMLSGVSGTGQTATTAGAQLGQQSAGNIGNYLTQAGNAAASGTVGSANAMASGISGAGNAVQNQYWLNRFLNQRNTATPNAANANATFP